MGLLRNMRRMPAWLKTEIGMTCLIALAVVAIVGFAWDADAPARRTGR